MAFDREVVREAESRVMAAEAQIFREDALQRLAGRPGLAWAKFYGESTS